MNKKILMMILGLFAVSLKLNAGEVWTNGEQVIKHVMWKPGYKGFYVDSSTYNNPQSCSNKNLYLIDESLPKEDIDKLYAMMLLAYSNGDKVHLWLSGCHKGWPKFTGLQINKK